MLKKHNFLRFNFIFDLKWISPHLIASEMTWNHLGNAWLMYKRRFLSSIKSYLVNRLIYLDLKNKSLICSLQDSNPMTLSSSSEEDKSHLSSQSRKPINRSRSAMLFILWFYFILSRIYWELILNSFRA